MDWVNKLYLTKKKHLDARERNKSISIYYYKLSSAYIFKTKKDKESKKLYT